MTLRDNCAFSHKAQPLPMNITLLGCGLMGTPMGQRLIHAGHALTVWNRSRDKTSTLAAMGARVASTAADACANAEVIITMLTDGDAVLHVLFDEGGAATAIPQGALFIDMSSIRPEQAQDINVRLAQHGVNAVDAPVSGGTLGAEAGTLAIMVGAQESDYARAEPILSILGRPTHVGPPGCGQLSKLANQMIVGITIGAVAEALLLAERGGANPAKVREALRGGFADSRILEVHGQRMVDQDFAKRGSLRIQHKDLRNAQHTAAQLGMACPITQQLEQLYALAEKNGWGDLDQSALYLQLAQGINSDGVD